MTTLLLGYAKKVGEYIFVEDVDTCVQSAWTGGGKVRGASLRGGKMLGASHWYLAFYHLADSHLALYPRPITSDNWGNGANQQTKRMVIDG